MVDDLHGNEKGILLTVHKLTLLVIQVLSYFEFWSFIVYFRRQLFFVR